MAAEIVVGGRRHGVGGVVDMHYVALIGQHEHDVEVIELSPARYAVVIGERRFEVDARAITESTLSLLIGDDAYDVEIEDRADGPSSLLVRGQVAKVEVLDLRKMRLRRAHDSVAGEDGPITITSPMPGKVVAVLVQEGDAVKAGQGLLVVEAMKMENELKAPRDGVVRELTAREGVPVDGGKALCVIE